jgi:molecular chaperone DnaK
VGVSARDVVTGQEQSITVTATSGLTEEELKRILDEQRDELLERKQTTREFELRRERMTAVLREVELLRAAAEAALEKTKFGKDAIQKADQVVARVRQAMAARDGAALAVEEEPLDRTLQLFKSLASGGPVPAGG